MYHYGNDNGDPQRPHASRNYPLRHRVSNVSDINDGPYTGQAPLRGRPSLVSLPSVTSLKSSYDRCQPATTSSAPVQNPCPATEPNPTWAHNTAAPASQSHSCGPSYSFSGWTSMGNDFTSYGGGSTSGGTYQPVGSSIGPPPQVETQTSSHAQPKSHYFGGRGFSLRRPQQETIPEERDSIDMATLLPHASPMATSAPFDQVPGHEPEPEFDRDMGTFDVTTFSGPLATREDAEIMKSLQPQQHEAPAQPTGRTGVGSESNTTIHESELLAAAAAVPDQWLGLPFPGRRSTLGRQATVKALGQSEANKRGEVIEVVIETPQLPPDPDDVADFDLSEMGGPSLKAVDQEMRQTTFPLKEQRKQIFYPQPNWKPFAMRWPYLLMLVLLSVLLAIGQEALYQISLRTPLLTFKSPTEIPPGLYFALKFAPTLTAVLFGVLWQLTDFEVRRLEAFYQLSKEGGALAADSINVDYITSFSFFRPFRALYCKHYAVFLSSVASLLAISAVPTLGAASIVLSPDRDKRLKDPLGVKTITISAVWSRILSSVLFIIGVLGCILFWRLATRRTGLLSDPKGIAGLASMAAVSHILMDFKDMDVATHREIHRKLKDHRYVIRNSSLAPEDSYKPPTKQEQQRYTKSGLSQNPHPLMLRAAGLVPLIAGIFGFFVLIYAVLFTKAAALADGHPWLITALAVCIKMGYSGLETDLRMMEPYYILWKRHAPPRTLTLDYTSLPFVWAAVRAALNGHLLVFFVGFGAIMAEILTVLATSLATVSGREFVKLAFNQQQQQQQQQDGRSGKAGAGTPDVINSGQETELSFFITLGLASFILLYMAAAAMAVLILRRRPFLPRQPNTIASVLAFIHNSKMLGGFAGTSKLNSKEMTRLLEEFGQTYGAGWFVGRDGQSHCGVDQEELLSGYRPGYDYTMATNPWETRQFI